MYELTLTGAQKTFLRSLGQRMEPSVKVGKGGVSPAFFAELQKLLRANELVKLRFVGEADRKERAALCAQIADEGRCLCVGAVGHTALFYRQHPEPEQRRVTLGPQRLTDLLNPERYLGAAPAMVDRVLAGE